MKALEIPSFRRFYGTAQTSLLQQIELIIKKCSDNSVKAFIMTAAKAK